MISNPFSTLKKREWTLWIISLLIVGISNILAGSVLPSTLLGTLIGVTALIFLAKGNVWGQILTVVFSILYAITSYEFKYYGEMITYLGMTMPIAIMSIVTWIKNPYEKGKDEVKIHYLTKKQKIMMVVLSFIVTWIFYYILKILDTPNLFFSTISITTSFLASYLMLYRNSYYAIAYSLNDIVLIVLWILASIENITYLPMIMCFLMFFVNDIYGFISWKKREKKQSKSAKKE
ncbi:MAG: nicotinamide mononucleotide transporter [Ruminococcaceae bacterium]|nr:nicotinamide mononucleotide transporter [Oscillospiraceae bacterium]